MSYGSEHKQFNRMNKRIYKKERDFPNFKLRLLLQNLHVDVNKLAFDLAKKAHASKLAASAAVISTTATATSSSNLVDQHTFE